MKDEEPGQSLPPWSSRPRHHFWIVDAFAERPFAGNPAGVVDVGGPDQTSEAHLASVAAELGFSETAFVARLPSGAHSLRWLTPSTEVDLCGHATLGAARALLDQGAPPPLRFWTRSGPLVVEPTGDDGSLAMRFPRTQVQAIEAPPGLGEVLRTTPIWVGRGDLGDLIVVLAEASLVHSLDPDPARVASLGGRAVVVTAQAAPRSEWDFVSRVFAPSVGVDEDPVTGSAHVELGLLWAERLGKRSLVGYQASTRTGVVRVDVADDHVVLTGRAIVVAEGELEAGEPCQQPSPALPDGSSPTVLLIRHGQTSLNAKGALRGRLDPPLDETGRDQADKLADALRSVPIRHVLSSPLRRTRQTAEALARHHGLVVVDDERLADRDWGPFAGMVEAEVKERYGSLDDLPGAEARPAMVTRAEAALADAAALASPGEVVAVVSHDALLRELLSTRLAWPRSPEDVPQRTGCWNALSHHGGRWWALLVDQRP